MKHHIPFIAFIASFIIFQPLQAQHPKFKVFGDSIKVYNAFTFSPDGKKMYTSEPNYRENVDGGEPVLPRWGPRNRPWVTLFEYDLVDGQSPANKRQLPFASDSLDSSPHINYAGTRLYFNSRRPIPGSTEIDGVAHVWYVEKLASGDWSEPQYLSAINRRGYYSSYAQEQSDRSIIFQSNIPGGVPAADGTPSQDLWISYFRDGQYQTPENLSALNSEIHEDQVVVNRKGDLIIFSRYDDSQMYLFYSTKSQDSWNEPVEVFITDLSGFKEQSPRLSIDEKSFCFAHGRLMMCAPLSDFLEMTSKY